MLKVQTFGSLEITYGDTPILLGKHSVTKAMKLLIILINCGSQGIARNKLLSLLFENEELSNAANSLRVTSHRLKKTLTEVGFPEHEYITTKGGFYYWDCPMKVYVDAREFEKLIAKAKKAETIPEKIDLLERALELYKGEFLAKMSAEEWVIMESLRLKNMYTEAMKEVCDYLMQARDYEEVLRLVEHACNIYPFDEWQAVQMDCYIAMNRYKDAMQVYEKTAKLLLCSQCWF